MLKKALLLTCAIAMIALVTSALSVAAQKDISDQSPQNHQVVVQNDGLQISANLNDDATLAATADANVLDANLKTADGSTVTTNANQSDVANSTIGSGSTADFHSLK